MSGWRSGLGQRIQFSQGKETPTNHQTKVKQALGGEVVQAATLLAQHDAGDDGGPRRAQAAAQRDRVLDVHVGLAGEAALVVAPQHVQGHAREQVGLRVQADLAAVLALALVRDAAVERVRRLRLAAVDADVQLQIHGQRQPDDIEARPDVGAGAGGLDDEGLGGGHGGGCVMLSCDVVFLCYFPEYFWFVFILPFWAVLLLCCGESLW